MSKEQERIEKRVNEAISASIKHHGFVSAIDILIGMGLLTDEKVQAWRKGQVPYLERGVVGGLGKISRAMKFFHKQAKNGGLKPSESAYLSRGSGKYHLQFSKSGNHQIEKAYRTHYISKALVLKKQERKNKMNGPDDELPQVKSTEPLSKKLK